MTESTHNASQTEGKAQPWALNELIDHLERHDCLPFPCGPRLPRRYTDRPPLVFTGTSVSDGTRADRGFRLMRHAFSGEAEKGSSVPRIYHHVWAACAEWDSRHLHTRLRRAPRSASVQLLLDAMAQIAHGAPAKGDPLADFTEQLLRAVKSRRSEWRPNRLIDDTRNDLEPFRACHYRCSCCEGPDHGSEREAIPSDDDIRSVTAWVQQPDGTWALLALMFFKLLFSHLGYIAKRQTHATATRRLFMPVARILERVVVRGSDPLAPAGAGLLGVLARIVPFYRGSQPGEAGALPGAKADAIKPDDGLPRCFNPFRLSDESDVLSGAKAMFAKVFGEGSSEEQLAVDTADLAREIASLLTDPASAPRLQLSQGTFAFLNNKFKNQRRELADLHKGKSRDRDPATVKADSDDLPFMHRCDPPESAARVFAPRMQRIEEYLRWMHEQGFKSAEAAQAESASAVAQA